MNNGTLQAARAEHAKYMPSRTKVATDLAAGLRLAPIPPGTTVRLGKHQREGGDIPAQYPVLQSGKVYAHVTAYGWMVLDRSDLIPA